MRTILIGLVLLMCQATFAVNDIPEKGKAALFKPLPQQTVAAIPPETKLTEAQLHKLKVDNEFWYIAMLCTLSVVSLTIVLTFLKSRNPSAKDIVNVTGLTLIIFATIILVLVVNTSEQLTAAIGILGAIAGYLFRSVQDSA